VETSTKEKIALESYADEKNKQQLVKEEEMPTIHVMHGKKAGGSVGDGLSSHGIKETSSIKTTGVPHATAKEAPVKKGNAKINI
jgi:hypothetical protein